MTNVVAGLTVRFQHLPVTVIDDVVKVFVKIAEQEGGRVGKYQLTAEAKDRAVSEGSASVTMVGTPPGFWVWRESGIRPHMIRPRRKKALAGGLSHPVWGAVQHPGVPGKQAWSKVAARAERELHDAVVAALDKAA